MAARTAAGRQHSRRTPSTGRGSAGAIAAPGPGWQPRREGGAAWASSGRAERRRQRRAAEQRRCAGAGVREHAGALRAAPLAARPPDDAPGERRQALRPRLPPLPRRGGPEAQRDDGRAHGARACSSCWRASPRLATLDLTGGAPELCAQFRPLVEGARALGRAVIDRCNLTVLLAARPVRHRGVPGRATACASSRRCPATRGRTSTQQRGRGVFAQSIEALQRLERARLRPARTRRSGSTSSTTRSAPACRPTRPTLEDRYRAELRELLRHRVPPPLHDHERPDQALRPRARARRARGRVPGAARRPLQSGDGAGADVPSSRLGRLGRRALRLRLQPDARAAARRPTPQRVGRREPGRRSRTSRSRRAPTATPAPPAPARAAAARSREAARRSRSPLLAVVALVFVGRAAGAHFAAFAAGCRGSGARGRSSSSLAYAAAVVAFVPGSILTLAAGAIFGLVPRHALRARRGDARLGARVPGLALRRARPGRKETCRRPEARGDRPRDRRRGPQDRASCCACRRRFPSACSTTRSASRACASPTTCSRRSACCPGRCSTCTRASSPATWRRSRAAPRSRRAPATTPCSASACSRRSLVTLLVTRIARRALAQATAVGAAP